MESATTQFLFVYGTLRSDQPEHRLHGPVPLTRTPGRVAGELYQLSEGYPILQVSPSDVLLTASSDWFGDWNRGLAMFDPGKPFSSPDGPFVKGELIEIPLEQEALCQPDRWEGFEIGAASVYQRVVIPAIRECGAIVPAWAYVCSKVPTSATLLPSGFWERPPWLGLG